MLSVDEALQQVLERVTPRHAVPFPLDGALGTVLAEDVTSDVDSPPHDKSLVDGYAVVSGDLSDGQAELAVVDEVTAGALPSRPVRSGEATRIMTGAPIPAGADAVVMVEQSELLPGEGPLGRVRLTVKAIAPGQNIMRRASSMARGQTVLKAGCVLRAIEIGVLAEVGRTNVNLVLRPLVAVLATGNELVPADVVPAAGQIRNSNGSLLVAAAFSAGAVAADLGIARDEPRALNDKLQRGLEADVLLISGGVSAGKLDLVPGALAAAGVEQVFHKVNLKPGKPLWFGTFSHENSRRHTLVFGLPGNPVSSLVCFELFVRPALARLSGREAVGLSEQQAELAAEYQHRGDRPTYHPARLVEDGIRRATVEPLRWQGSGDLRTLVDANALACFPAGTATYPAGHPIRVLRWP